MGKIVIVTGASSGLGKAVAREFRRNGCTVVALCRTEPEPETADRFFSVDLTDARARSRAVEAILAEYGRVDVLVNNAGIGSYATWRELTAEDLRREVELDFLAPVALTRELLDALIATGGSVINISSAAAFVPVACMGAYNAVKAALRMFSITLQMEEPRIHVLNVCPGRIDTGFSSRALGGRKPPETPGRTASNAGVFARRLYRAWRRRRRELVYPRWYVPVFWFVRAFPGINEAVNRRIWKL